MARGIQTCPRILIRKFSWRKMQYFDNFSSKIYGFIFKFLERNWKRKISYNFFQDFPNFFLYLPRYLTNCEKKNSGIWWFCWSIIVTLVVLAKSHHISVYPSVIGVPLLISPRLSLYAGAGAYICGRWSTSCWDVIYYSNIETTWFLQGKGLTK